MTNSKDNLFQIKTVWYDDGRIWLLDQTLLPAEEKTIEISSVEQMWDAIKRLAVRGAPAIGVAAGYGVWIAARNAAAQNDDVRAAALSACDYLATSRPTAVNLFYAINHMREFLSQSPDISGQPLADAILAQARRLHNKDLESSRAIGRHGAELIRDGDTLLTHCNAGALATSGFGTALAPMFWAHHVQGKNISVYADETRPLLQGSRLTAWELQKAGIPVTVICDSAAASVIASSRISAIIVGADRIAANGDVANKVGTLSVALAAKYHNVPFYVAAPWSTIDPAALDGASIPIEERSASEISRWGDHQTTPSEIQIHNPAFDVTPAALVTAYITDHGVFSGPPSAQPQFPAI